LYKRVGGNGSAGVGTLFQVGQHIAQNTSIRSLYAPRAFKKMCMYGTEAAGRGLELRIGDAEGRIGGINCGRSAARDRPE